MIFAVAYHKPFCFLLFFFELSMAQTNMHQCIFTVVLQLTHKVIIPRMITITAYLHIFYMLMINSTVDFWKFLALFLQMVMTHKITVESNVDKQF